MNISQHLLELERPSKVNYTFGGFFTHGHHPIGTAELTASDGPTIGLSFVWVFEALASATLSSTAG